MSKTNLYSFRINTLEGKPFDLSSLRGRKVLLVNTASACGYTPQYSQLEELHRKWGNKLCVIGIPSNDFGAQEPGTAEEIRNFCDTRYGVTFPLMEKTVTLGDAAHPLFRWLSDKKENGVNEVKPQWNFGKYLVSETGDLMAYFSPAVSPFDEEITRLI